ncbi:MAG: indolepyruvate oxidoreductase subunit beta [Chloroflexi bacterium]|nr:indolepyruvate oxidoreductase subunit beta [Chloroflexota bacterium]
MNLKKKHITNVILAGVGGQGSVLASRLLARAALKDGQEVKLAETFGAATRGGSVMTHVRVGEVWAPMMMEDEADVVVALEPLEGLRVAHRFLKPGGWVLLNTRPWYPVDVAVGRARYPTLESIVEALERLDARVLTIDATDASLQAGDARAANTVMLGGLFALGVVDITAESLFQAMEDRWPSRLVELNRKAYELGYQAIQKSRGKNSPLVR